MNDPSPKLEQKNKHVSNQWRNGDQAPAHVLAGHDELRGAAGQEAEQDPGDQIHA